LSSRAERSGAERSSESQIFLIQMKIYYIYIMASISGILYIGMTNDLEIRVFEHKHELTDGFTKKYKCKILVYFESSNDVKVILEREKQLKRWNRKKKLALIRATNPKLQDLSTESADWRIESR